MTRSLATSLLVASTASLLALSACSSGSARTSSIQSLTGNATAGATLYASNCSGCHGTDGRSGSTRRDVVSPTKNSTAGAIDQIVNGGDGMPSFSSLTDQNIADIVAHMKTL